MVNWVLLERKTMTKQITWNEVTDIEIDGRGSGYPDFVDVTLLGAWHIKENRPCTDEELDTLALDYDTVGEIAREWFE